MVELVLWSCGAVLVGLLATVARLCLRSQWDVIAALALFILAYGIAGDALSRVAEAAVTDVAWQSGGLARATCTALGAALSIFAVAAACIATVRLCRGAITARGRSRETA